ncbi:MAG: glycosyltransferase [Pseudomonadota bacterium]
MWNDAARLERCLAALAPQIGEDVEVIVVDNGSEVYPEDVITKTGRARLVTETAKGAGSARNRGVKETTAPVLAFLDCDCLPASDWLEQVRTVSHAITGGAVEIFDETNPPRTGAEAFEHVFAFDQKRYIEDKGFSVTANLVVPRSVFDIVGPFRVGVSEDMDWCHRARDVGYAVQYAPMLRVRHPSRANWVALAKKWRRLTDEMFAIETERPGGRLRWALKGLLMTPSVVVHLPRIVGAGGLTAGERARGTGTLVRLRLMRMVWMLGQTLTGRSEL